VAPADKVRALETGKAAGLGVLQSLRTVGRNFAAHPLTREDQLGAWARFAAWHLRSRLSPEVVTSWIGGQRLVVRPGMTGATGNLYYGLHEFMSMGLVLHFLRDGDLFLDAGANVGTYTVLASGVCRARTLAIEADCDTARDLARNVEVNGLQELVTIEVLALGPEDGEVMFTTGLGAMNQVVTERREGVRIVPQRTLDHVVGDRQPHMLKLDVEKYEDQVLEGSIEVLKKPSLKVVALEATSDWSTKLFTDLGFERAFYDPFTRILQREPNALAFSDGKWTRSNEFFVRDWEFVEDRVKTAKPFTVLGRTV
jgi:FkbM family methyltransferase